MQMKILQLISALYKLMNYYHYYHYYYYYNHKEISTQFIASFSHYWLSQNQNLSYHNDPSEEWKKKPLRANENTKLNRLNGLKRGKTRATKSGLVFVLHLTGWESGARFVDQAQSKVKQNWNFSNAKKSSFL